MSKRRSQRLDFLQPVDEWTPDEFILRFWKYAQGYAANKFGGYQRQKLQSSIDDLQGVAIDSLIKFAREVYPRWAAEHHTEITDARMFWALARRRINWDVDTWVEKQPGDTHIPADEDEDDYSVAWMRVQHDSRRESNNLLLELAAQVEKIDIAHRAVLAMYYFEEMYQKDMATILAIDPNKVMACMRAAEDVVLHHALALAANADKPAPRPVLQWPNKQFDEWVQDTYHCSTEAYMKYVAICFSIDVSYLVDIIRASNGDRIRRVPGGAAYSNNGKLTDDQVRQIRVRLAEGERGSDIAAAYGVSRAIIYSVKRGESYQHVA